MFLKDYSICGVLKTLICVNYSFLITDSLEDTDWFSKKDSFPPPKKITLYFFQKLFWDIFIILFFEKYFFGRGKYFSK